MRTTTSRSFVREFCSIYRFDCKYSPAKAVNEQNSEQKNESNRNTTIQCICKGTFVNTDILYLGFDSTFLYNIYIFFLNIIIRFLGMVVGMAW